MSIPKTQEQFLQDALNLKKDNPELDIVFCTSYDELCDEYAWSCQQIDSVAIHPWYEHRERIYTDEQSILEELEEEIYNEKMSDEDLESEAKKIIRRTCKTENLCIPHSRWSVSIPKTQEQFLQDALFYFAHNFAPLF